MSVELSARPRTFKGGGELAANKYEMETGLYGRLINRSLGELEGIPKLVVNSAPGKEPHVHGSEKLTDEALRTIASVKPGVSKDLVERRYEPIVHRFMSIVHGYNLSTAKYEILLHQYLDEILCKKAHSGEPEIIMAHILADLIPGAVLIDPTDYLRVDQKGRFVFDEGRSGRTRLENEIGRGIGIMPGFVVAGPDGRATTLSRGGSDASAGAISRVLNTDCIIYTNTDGVRSSDPQRVSGTLFVPDLTYQELAEATLGGTYVVHEQTIPPLEEKNKTLYVRHHKKPDLTGTRVERLRSKRRGEGPKIVTGATRRQTLTVRQFGIDPSSGFIDDLTGTLRLEDISIHDVATNTNSVTFAVDQGNGDLRKAAARLRRENPSAKVSSQVSGQEVATISIIGQNMPNIVSRVMTQVGSALESIGVNPKMMTYTEGPTLTVYVPKKSFNEALQVVHTKVIHE